MTETDLKAVGESLSGLVEVVKASLAEQEEAALEVDELAGKVGEVCGYLREQIEATTVAQAGLEAILSAYTARYGPSAEELEDVVRFRAILEEKERKLNFLQGELETQAVEVQARLDELARRQERTDQSLDQIEETMTRIGAVRQASLDRLAQDKAKLDKLKKWFRPTEDIASPAPTKQAPRINLSLQTLHSVIDQVVEGLAPNEEKRRELLGQVLETVRNPDLREVINQKIEAAQPSEG